MQRAVRASPGTRTDTEHCREDEGYESNRGSRNPAADAFRAPDAPTLVTRVLHKSTMSAVELRCKRRNFGKTAPIPVGGDIYVLTMPG